MANGFDDTAIGDLIVNIVPGEDVRCEASEAQIRCPAITYVTQVHVVTDSIQKAALKELLSVVDTASPCCLLYTSPSPRDLSTSRMPSSA